MTNPTQVPGIPRPPSTVDAETRAYLTALAEAVEIRLGRRGDPLDRAITLRELVAGGLAVNLQGDYFNELRTGSGNTIGPAPTPAIQNLSPPAIITSLAASGAYSVINLSWAPIASGTGVLTEVWSHTSDVLGDAVLTAVVSGFTYTDPVGSAQTRYYWARAVSQADIFGPFNASAGTAATTAADVDFQLGVLANAITSSELATSLATPIGNLPANTANSISTLETEQNAQGVTITAQAGTISTLGTEQNAQGVTIGAQASTISTLETEQNAQGVTIAAQAGTISTLNSTVGANSTSISTQATTVNGLKAQYSVKIDNNGHISGFGLSSTTTTAGPTSAFIVRADRFAVIDPASTADGLGTTTPTADNVPFFIDSGTTYIKAAAIKDASITSAKVGSLNANQISTGTLSADRLGAGSIGVNKLNLVGTGAQINLKSAASGARMVLQEDKIEVFDSSNTLRVKLGNL